MTPLNPLLAKRLGAKAYTSVGISDDDLRSLLEAARWAPSSRNDQPWAFVVARRGEPAFEGLLSCLLGTNPAWAKDTDALFVCAAAKKFSDLDRPNRHAWHDLGSAIMAMAVQGVSLGLQMREMGGIDYDKVRAHAQVPESYDVVSVLGIGHPADQGGYPAMRVRKAVEEFAFEGVWGARLR